MMSALIQHTHIARIALRRIFASPIAGFLNVMVIGIALCLPAGMYVLLQNAQGLISQLSATPQISLFLTMETTEDDIARLRDQLAHQDDVGSVEFVSRTDALAKLGKNTGLDDVIAGLDSNPLPDAFIIKAKSSDAKSLDALRIVLQRLPNVELAQLDSAWAYKLEAILKFARISVLILASLLSLAIDRNWVTSIQGYIIICIDRIVKIMRESVSGKGTTLPPSSRCKSSIAIRF